MTKFNAKGTRPVVQSPVKSTVRSGRTHEGHEGWARDAESELFLMCVGAMGAEDAFYETARQRNSRFIQLVRQIAVTNPDWLAGFLPWLRTEGGMRTTPIMGAAEFAWARRDEMGTGRSGTLYPVPKVSTRQVVASVLQRADEPAELIAYWTSRYGKSLPKPVKRGIADAIRRLYSEYTFLRYDTDKYAYRFGDVLDLTHPDAKAPADVFDRWSLERMEELGAEGMADYVTMFEARQADLFEWALASRRNRDSEPAESLSAIRARRRLSRMGPNERHQFLRWVKSGDKSAMREFKLAMAGKWEWANSWAGEGKPAERLSQAEIWELLIPNMNYFALLRNLRNFDQAGVSDVIANAVAVRITDRESVRKSGVFPFQILAAYREAPSLRWAWPLEQALNMSLENVPALPGRTLILVDRSPSMWMQKMSKKSDMLWADAAAVFGAALALRAEKADLVEFWANSKVVPFSKGDSALKLTERFSFQPAPGGTDIPRAVAENLKPHHDRVIIVTDEQSAPGYLPSNMERYPGGYRSTPVNDLIPVKTPVFIWNFGGYTRGVTPSGEGARHTLGGLSDASFKLIKVLENRRSAKWPWEQDPVISRNQEALSKLAEYGD